MFMAPQVQSRKLVAEPTRARGWVGPAPQIDARGPRLSSSSVLDRTGLCIRDYEIPEHCTWFDSIPTHTPIHFPAAFRTPARARGSIALLGMMMMMMMMMMMLMRMKHMSRPTLSSKSAVPVRLPIHTRYKSITFSPAVP